MSGSRVLVVANPADAERLAGWLRAANVAGVTEVVAGDGSDDTLAEVARGDVAVVVLSAGLEAGDALAFSAALRAEGGAEARLVLIGEESGPVRTALDADEYQATMFLRRPVAPAALVYAVRTCFEKKPRAQRAEVAARLDRATAQALDEIGDELIERSLLESDSAAGSGARAESGSRSGSGSGSGSEFGSRSVSGSGSESGSKSGSESDSEPATATAPAPAPDSGSGSGHVDVNDDVDVDVFVHGSDRDRAPEREGERDPDPDPPLREPTQIISSSSGNTPPPYQAPAESGTGAFVTDLRKHMSLVEARLFGDVTPVSSDPDPDPDGDIDLDSFGINTMPGLAMDRFAAPEEQIEPLPPISPAPATTGSGARGDLADEDVATLLARLARARFAGQIELRRGDAIKKLFLEDGRVIFATSNLPHDRMGDLLVREGKITRARGHQARELAADSGRRLGEVLVELGSLKRRELLPAVRRHVEDIVYSLFAWDAGSFTLHAGAGGPGGARDEKIRLAGHPSALIVEGIRRKMSRERLERLVGPPSTVLMPLEPEAVTAALADAELAPDERLLIPRFDGRNNLDEVAAGGELGTVYALAHALCALGAARRLDFTREVTDSGRVSAPVSSITGAADLGIDRERVLAKHAQVREADYFALLGVRRDASAFEIKRAWEGARRDYAVDSFPHELARELAAELADIGVVLDEAQRILRDDRIRAAYAAHLVD